MPTFLQPVAIPQRCYLFEVVLWLAFRRLPVATGDAEGNDIRESDENRVPGRGGYSIQVLDDYIFDEECEYAGIPPDPSWRAALEETATLSVGHYDELLKECNVNDPFRKHLEEDREEAIRFQAAMKEWEAHFQRVIEYPASRIFVALRDGSLAASGKLLPAFDLDEAVAKLSEEGLDIFDIEPTPIPKTFWTLQGIDFKNNTAQNGRANYCYITLATEDVLSVFPGERAQVSKVERVGDTFIVSEPTATPLARQLRRGRPSYAWEPFHIEVTSLLQQGALPKKKEAAIQLLQDWFERELNVRPSRAAISQKLTPYFEAAARAAGQKSN